MLGDGAGVDGFDAIEAGQGRDQQVERGTRKLVKSRSTARNRSPGEVRNRVELANGRASPVPAGTHQSMLTDVHKTPTSDRA
jgi:hypothetical protein